MINDVSDAFDGWLEIVTLSRPTTTYESGRPTTSNQSISFYGVVQNANPRDLKVLPEGDRNTEAIKIHTETEIKQKDLISYDSSSWLVSNISNRRIGNYYKVIAVKQ